MPIPNLLEAVTLSSSLVDELQTHLDCECHEKACSLSATASFDLYKLFAKDVVKIFSLLSAISTVSRVQRVHIDEMMKIYEDLLSDPNLNLESAVDSFLKMALDKILRS